MLMAVFGCGYAELKEGESDEGEETHVDGQLRQPGLRFEIAVHESVLVKLGSEKARELLNTGQDLQEDFSHMSETLRKALPSEITGRRSWSRRCNGSCEIVENIQGCQKLYSSAHVDVRSFPDLLLPLPYLKNPISKQLISIINHHIADPPGARHHNRLIQPTIPLISRLHSQMQPHPELRRPRRVLLVAQTLEH
jgi:hypothetical protein